ncbi:MAG: ATPase [Desulfobulbaceae bacterium]|nr:ATPase [Desulfobulbaceae bacterium]
MDKSRYGRRDRLIQEKRHDAYQDLGKWPEPTVCTECRALFHDGRWTWEAAPEYAHTTVCPACHRIADNYPAGHLEIRGTFLRDHCDELMNLIRNIEKQEKGEHPMERIMAVSDEKDHTLVTTTGIHLGRRIGEALKHSYQGELDFTYGDAENSILVVWSRQ